ncbi:hypothetical protein [Parahaliea mediterranea]|uniref:CsbD family protein n=1 Tax=Parahaliea mediterranea TaxID=651086 RepID=A0A939DD79_9GAMM|nr:hypothetical protein [Parahaliea mediterranea]MBN7795925.1 hypothetical protein [Parahaliea mediterranea]
MKLVPAAALLFALSVPALADLKPEIIDCDAGKAARNAAMKATIGVKGPCDAERLADDARDDVGDKMDDVRKGAGDKAEDMRDKHKDKRDHKQGKN